MAKHALSHQHDESYDPSGQPEASGSEELRAPRPGEPIAATHDDHQPTYQEHTSHVNPETAEHASHAVALWKMLLVFAVLLLLTGLTVAVATEVPGVGKLDLGYEANLIVAIAIATVKATVVALYFMHLRYDSPFNSLIMIIAVLFVALFIGISVLDSRQYAPLTEAPRQALP